MWGGVMLEFGGREEVDPISRIVGAKDAKVRFYLLIGAFRLSIRLRMVSGGEFDVILKESG